MTKNYNRYRSGEWSALYEDGKLVVVGDHYLTDDYLEDVLGVNVIHNDDFLTDDHRGALQTLEEVNARSQIREARQMEAQKLRDQAASLLRTAEKLESEW